MITKLKSSIAFCLLLLKIAYSEESIDFSDFDLYQHKFTKEEISSKIKTCLEKDYKICDFYRLTNNALYIGDIDSGEFDYILYFSDKNQNKSKSRKHRSLEGLKVAIDPGHFGGDLSELEERYIYIPGQETEDGRSVSFNEGTLTYLTAMELKSYLENEGAIVLCTRDGIGKGAIDQDFYEWLEENQHLIQENETLSKVFRRHYNREDLICRAAKINAFKPDITVIIHYNVHLTQKEKEQKKWVTKTDYNLAFVPGAFCENELSRPFDRYDFLHLLLTDQIEESIRLSKCLLDQFVKELKVPLIESNEKTSYTDSVCIKLRDGIYARNLALTRMVRSPLCYGETLIQNNQDEYRLLSNMDTEINGVRCSSRIKSVAKAYFNGIKSYIDF